MKAFSRISTTGGRRSSLTIAQTLVEVQQMTEMTPKTFRPQMWCKGVSDKNDEYHRRKSDLEVNIYTVCNLYFAPNIQEKYTNGHYIDTACFHKN